jgi:hypothetical protein
VNRIEVGEDFIALQQLNGCIAYNTSTLNLNDFSKSQHTLHFVEFLN